MSKLEPGFDKDGNLIEVSVVYDSSRLNSAINTCCRECGLEANRRTCLKKYGAEPKKAAFDVSTFHKGKCDWCGKIKSVTQARDFFYPDFSLLLEDNFGRL